MSPPLPTPAQLGAHIDSLDAGLHTMRGQARIRYQGPKDKFRSSQMVAVQAPNLVRIDVMNPFGVSYSLASDGSRLTAFDRRESRFYEGSASARNVSRLAGVPLSMDSLAALVRGLPPKLDTRGEGQVSALEGHTLWRRDLVDGGVLDLIFEVESLRLASVSVLDSTKSQRLAAKFSDFREDNDVEVPRRIDVSFEDGATMELIYERVWPGVAMGEASFTVKVPASVERINLDD
ncbi:MAG: hypothetical protein ACI8TX_000842 [Hyphomicrobiaceae bacterium]|jgi:hypothetical protein